MLIPFLPSRHHRSHRRLRAEAYRKLALETLEERVNPSLAFGFALGGDTSGLSDSTGVAADSAGNIYVTGYFDGTVHFGGNAVTSQGARDAFVAKYSSSGTFDWMADLGGVGAQASGSAIAVDSSGNVFTTGFFTGTANFDPNSTNHQLTATGSFSVDSNAYVSELNTSGQYVMAVDLGSGGSTFGYGIALDGSDNIFTTGDFYGTNVNFDPNSTGHQLSTSNSGNAENAYVSMLNSSGQFVWADDLGYGGTAYGNAIALDSSDDVYTVGDFEGTNQEFDPNSGNHQLSSSPNSTSLNIYVSKLNSSGLYLWADQIVYGGNVSSAYAPGIAVDGSGNVYTTGRFSGSNVNFDPASTNHQLSGINGSDFISKLNSSGQYVFAEQLGSDTSYVQGLGLALDSSDNIYTTGTVQGSAANFDPNSTNHQLSSSATNCQNSFMSELTSSGQYVTAVLIGDEITTGDFSNGLGIALDSANDIDISGAFTGVNCNFNPFGTQYLSATGSGSGDFYLTQLTQQAPPVVTVNPSNATVDAGANTSFTSAATGNPTPTAQWQVSTDGGHTFNNVGNGGVYSGATTSTLSITGATTAMNGYEYQEVYTNSYGTATTTPATLTVDFAPTVTTDPMNTTVIAGGNMSFTASANDGYPVPTTVQWQVSTNGGSSFSNVANGGVYGGATTPVLTISGALASQNGYEYQAIFSNSANLSDTTTAATLTVDYAPAISTNPSSATTNAGANASFAATATGNPAPTVQWQVSSNGGSTFSNVTNGGVYSGATTTTLDITGATAAMNGYEYQAIFSNTLLGAGSPSTATTTTAILTVDFAPVVSTNPSNQTVNAGNNTSFAATATGNPTPTVQWMLSTNGGTTFSDVTNGGVYGGATSNTLTITGATASMNGYEYEAVYSNTLFGAGSPSMVTTTSASLTVDFAPTVTTNPSNRSINAGSNTTFTAAATGNPNPNVQWMVSSDGGSTFTNVNNGGVYSGATTTTLSITGATAAMNGQEFDAVFSNTLFGAGSPSTATTTAANLTVDFAPVVSGNPTNQTINAGSNTTFTASATGNPTPTVQWQVSTNGGAAFSNVTNGGFYSGATSTALTITGATAAMNGYEYQAIFSNTLLGAGSPSTATTTAATLTVDFAPVVTTNPANQTVNAGNNTSFTAAATGNPTPAVQWLVSTNGGATFNNITNGGVYSGATTTTLDITGATAAMNGFEYQAIFSNTLLGAGSPSTATTTSALLTVDLGPVIITNPSNQTVNAGNNTSFTAAATGNPNPTVQWMLSTNGGTTFSDVTNGGVYSGAASTTLKITGATVAMNSYEYEAVFSNLPEGASSPATATTTAATLTVDYATAISNNPSNTTANAGANASFSATATGNPTPAVQWQVSSNGGSTFTNIADGGVYSGATTTTLDITGATAAMNGYEYQAIFSNTLLGAGSPSTATTTSATLTVDFAPVVSTNPSNQTVNAGSNTSFAATATGNPNPSVQWMLSTNGGATFSEVTNGGVYGGATSTTLTITGATAAMNGYEYEAVFSNTLSGAGSPSTATTNSASLTVDFAPAVSGNPTSQSINAGSNTSFTAVATGNPAPSVQWMVSSDGGSTFTNVNNGGLYSGATTTTLSITGATAAMNGQEFKAVFSNTLLGAGSPSTATTTAANLTIDSAPVVSGNPTNQTINAGSNTSFTAAATGNPTPAVQWQVSTNGGAAFSNVTNGGAYSGATSTALTITGATAAMNGYEYEAVFSNTLLGAGSPSTATTTAATLTVDFAPVVSGNPTNQTINAGSNTTFTAAATGNPAPAIQWMLSTNGGSSFSSVTNGGVYSGATTTTLNIAGATTSMNGYVYQAVFSNTLVGAGSPATATTTTAILTVDFAPVVSTNPSNEATNVGRNTSFSVAASANPSPTVQWMFSANGGSSFSDVTNGGIYGGANTDTLTITGATAPMNGYLFEAVFSNTLSGAGSPSTATTSTATLSVDYAPAVTTNPMDQTVLAGTNASFTASATGSPTPDVQWMVSTNGGISFTPVSNGGVYSGATTNTLAVTGATASMNGNIYQADFSNTLAGAGSPSTASTTPATLTVQSAPTITVNPFNATVIASLDVFPTATFTAAASGSPASTVQWQILYPGGSAFQNLGNNSNYSGVNSNTLTVSGITLAMDGFQYRAVFTNGIGSPAQSTAATLNAVYRSQDAYIANAYAYQAYVYAYAAYVYGYGSYGTFVLSYYAYADAAIAFQAASNGELQVAENYAYNAYYYGFLCWYYASIDYANSNNGYSYYALTDAYQGQYYSYFTAQGV